MIYSKNKFILIIICIIFFCFGFLTKQYFFKKNVESFSELRRIDVADKEFKYINPLLECEQSNFYFNKNLNKVKLNIQEKIQKEISNKNINFVAVYFRDLNNGPWFGINEKSNFKPASLIKIPLMMAYFYKAEKDPSILNQTIKIEDNYDYSIQGIVPEVKLEKDYIYTVEELIERMIIYSDNYAYSLLLSNIDIPSIIHVYDSVGISYNDMNNSKDYNILNIKDYSAFLRVLFNSSYLDRQYSEKALSILAKSRFSDGIVKKLPFGLEVSHKFGESISDDSKEFQLHDCGIVYVPKKPYLLCVMTRGYKKESLSLIISDISKIIYDYVIE